MSDNKCYKFDAHNGANQDYEYNCSVADEAREFVRNTSADLNSYKYGGETRTTDGETIKFETSYSASNDEFQNFTTSYSADSASKFSEPSDTTCACDEYSSGKVPNPEYKSSNTKTTEEEFMCAINQCRDIFIKKLSDYGASWRIMRPASVTDQIYIKANRIRSLQEIGDSWVGEGVIPEFMAIVNYGIVGLIQLDLGYSKFGSDITADEALEHYDKWVQVTYDLMVKKNHDYDEAWRLMRMHSYTDLILAKLFRTMQIEENDGVTIASEGIDANYLDMMNYAIFALIKSSEK